MTNDANVSELTNTELADLRAGGSAMVFAYQTIVNDLSAAIATISADLFEIEIEIAKRVNASSN